MQQILVHITLLPLALTHTLNQTPHYRSLIILKVYYQLHQLLSPPISRAHVNGVGRRVTTSLNAPSLRLTIPTLLFPPHPVPSILPLDPHRPTLPPNYQLYRRIGYLTVVPLITLQVTSMLSLSMPPMMALMTFLLVMVLHSLLLTLVQCFYILLLLLLNFVMSFVFHVSLVI